MTIGQRHDRSAERLVHYRIAYFCNMRDVRSVAAPMWSGPRCIQALGGRAAVGVRCCVFAYELVNSGCGFAAYTNFWVHIAV